MNKKFRHQSIEIIKATIAVLGLAALIVASAGLAVAADNPSSNFQTALFEGKTIWVVDVNSNEDYNSLLMDAVEKLLPDYATGVKAQRVKTGNKNPFFLLKKENYPAAVIAGIGVCVATTPQSVNYASSALKLGIPVVILHVPEMRDKKDESMKSYRVSDLRSCEIANCAPETAPEAEELAKAAAPALVKALAEQLEK
ncbi:MAG: hypothetical protein FWE89_01835 [Syntrophaceae bacterium]|nr:hypothetical protein [Syntrophaceae bacterium]